MRSLNLLQKDWDDRFHHRPHRLAAAITDAGIVLAAETVLMRMEENEQGLPRLAVEQDEERLMALLSIAYLCRIPPSIKKNVANASAQWTRGEKVLAHFHLAFARLPRLGSARDVYRLYLAGSQIEDGMPPRTLLRRFGLDRTTRQLVKYNPYQPLSRPETAERAAGGQRKMARLRRPPTIRMDAYSSRATSFISANWSVGPIPGSMAKYLRRTVITNRCLDRSP